MANNQKFTLTFDAQLNVNQMKGALSQIQSTLNGLHLPQNISQGLQNTFNKLSNEVRNFEVLVGKDITSKADFTKLEKSAVKITDLFSDLKIQISDLGKLSGDELNKLFPSELTNKIKKATEAIQTYESKVKTSAKNVEAANKNVSKKYDEITAATKRLTEAQENLSSASRNDINKVFKKTHTTDIEEARKGLQDLIDKATEYKNKVEAGIDKNEKKHYYSDTTKEKAKRQLEDLQMLQTSFEKQVSTIVGYEGAVKKAETEIAKLNKSLETLQVRLERIKNESSEADAKALQELFDTLNKSGFDTSSYEQNIEGAKQAILDFVNTNQNKVKESLNTAADALEENSKAVNENKEAVDKDKKVWGEFDERLSEVNQLKQRITYFFGLNNTIQLVKRTMKSAISTIKELDAAMTATAVVTDFTVADMWEQLPEYTKRANELGVSTKAAYEAATLYYQQGLKTNEVMAISNETLKMARIAGLNAATATDRVTNAIRGFNMAINEVNAQRINDVYSRLAAISASNVDEISTAMTKVASLANSANMKFESTAAFLAQIINISVTCNSNVA